MRRTLALVALLSAPSVTWAKKASSAPAGAAHAQAPNARAMGELAGKFKWGMSYDDVFKVIGEGLQARYDEKIAKEIDTFKQDQLRKEQGEELDKIKASLVAFDGTKGGWDVSLIDKEFAHRDEESMVVIWEKDQRRFLFFWHGKLYKQYIAFNAEHPAFKGKTFDDFAKLIQNRYGTAEMKFSQLKTKDEMTLDHLEWPSANDITLWAIDQSQFYGNFCLSLTQTSSMGPLAKSRAEHSPRVAKGNAIIDSISTPDKVQGDPNADIVDQIVGGKKGTAPPMPEPTAAPDDAPKKKKGKGKS